jgi:hypothetical protein
MSSSQSSSELIYPEYVVQRAMREWPSFASSEISPQSTCVTSFGNPDNCRLATIGLNPNSLEFLSKRSGRSIDSFHGRLPLERERKRFCDYETLGLPEGSPLNDNQAIQVIDKCHEYFDGDETHFFKVLTKHVLGNLSEDLAFGRNVTHLDLVQWSTVKPWKELETTIRERLIEQDFPFLIQQIENYKFKAIFLNGQTVMKEFGNQIPELKLELVFPTRINLPPIRRSSRSVNYQSGIYRGELGKTLVLGYTGFVSADPQIFSAEQSLFLREKLPEFGEYFS